MMGVMVKMHNGDVERFESATSYGPLDDGCLELVNAQGSRVALFSPGWAGAWAYAPKHVNDQEMRKIAASETSKALDRLADSISRKSG